MRCFSTIQVADVFPCPSQQTDTFRLTAEPLIEWWIRVVDGVPAGWALVGEGTIRLAGRSF